MVQAGLFSCFDATAVSGEVGVGKPGRAVFDDLLARLDTRPDESVMVGDSWETEVLGGTAAGMAACRIAAGRATPGPLDGVMVIDHVAQLPAVLV
jgi:putative hydrolase of the HAD superfamily